MLRSSWLRQVLLCLFLLLDSYLGLIHNTGIIGWSGLFTGEIKWLAFQNCSRLERVIIPESVTEIGSGAFDLFLPVSMMKTYLGYLSFHV